MSREAQLEALLEIINSSDARQAITEYKPEKGCNNVPTISSILSTLPPMMLCLGRLFVSLKVLASNFVHPWLPLSAPLSMQLEVTFFCQAALI